MTRLKVPTERLPQDSRSRHAALRDYFCDKDATAVRSKSGWEIKLNWTGGDGRHVDPALKTGLAGWDNIPEERMWNARHRTGRVLTSLYDSWTLLAWSEWLASMPTTDRLTILHVDDHRDLASPRLFRRGPNWIDPFTDSAFDLLDPRSVEAAIASGAIGMGSFLTPVLHQLPDASVRQLTQPPKVRDTCNYSYKPIFTSDDLIEPGATRPAIELTPISGKKPGNYRITNQLDDWLADVASGPILLHIDMDYFSNRYDGDSDWELREETLDPLLGDVITRIEIVGKALRQAKLFSRIVSVAIAYSPGFFPAEYWQPASEALEGALKEFYA